MSSACSTTTTLGTRTWLMQSRKKEPSRGRKKGRRSSRTPYHDSACCRWSGWGGWVLISCTYSALIHLLIQNLFSKTAKIFFQEFLLCGEFNLNISLPSIAFNVSVWGKVLIIQDNSFYSLADKSIPRTEPNDNWPIIQEFYRFPIILMEIVVYTVLVGSRKESIKAS